MANYKMELGSVSRKVQVTWLPAITEDRNYP